MKKILKISVYVFLAVMLNGCFLFKHGNYSRGQESQGRQNIAPLIEQLSKYNIRVLRRDKFVFLVLPNKKFFISNAANFTCDAYKALDLILSFSNFYKGSSIAVIGCFEDEYNSFGRALAQERAHKIVQFLWRSKVYANFIYEDDKSQVVYDNKVLSDCILIEFMDF